MISNALKQAREFETKYHPFIDVSKQPRFHLTGGIGWINDPNGFSVYKGEYHLFYQYHPYDTKWGPMHWGHAKTRDFIRWERLPAALAPDEEYDQDGCFSGSAVELPDGRQLLLYTGVRRKRREDGYVVDYQTQCAAIGDGVDFEKYDCNPVIGADLLPKGGSELDFRDPKIWREGDAFYAVVGNRCEDDSGTVLLFESDDGLHWRYVSVLSACHNQYGKMWECPDFFPLDDKAVLLVSPQEMKAIGLEFHPGNANVCLIGHYDRERHHLMRERVQAIDYGLDFYAPQTLSAPDGRRIMIAWMQNWDTALCCPKDLRFMGQMTIPRELAVRDGRLIQNPVRELERYRGVRIDYYGVQISSETTLNGISGRCLDMTLTVRPGNDSVMYRWFKLYIARDGEHRTTIRYKPESSTLRIDRTNSGFPHDIVNVRDFPVRAQNGEIKLRVILDRYSVELFVNDGEQAASTVIYTPTEATSIGFVADGAVLIDVEKYDLVFDENNEKI